MKYISSSFMRSCGRGYSLVELIVATGLLGIVMTSMVATFTVFASGSKEVAAYTEMSQQSRKALEFFSRDIRAAEDVTVASQYEIVVQIPEDFYYAGGTVQYVFDKDVHIFSRVVRDKLDAVSSNQILLDGVANLTFGFFDPLGQSLDSTKESLLLSIKSVQVDAEMLRTVARRKTTDYIISARVMMRNRLVTE